MNRCPLFIVLALVLSCTETPSVKNLKTEFDTEPIWIDFQNPRLSWQLKGDFCQKTCRIMLSDSRGLIWDSGIIENEKPWVILEEGLLKSFEDYRWSVIVSNGIRSLKSPEAQFSTAFMDNQPWKAKWINDGRDKDVCESVMLRKHFDVRGPVRRARLYYSAAAYAKVSIGGKPVTKNVLDPGYTHYDKRNLYQVYDVTRLLRKGDNCIESVLGNGFYNVIQPNGTWDFHNARWRGRPRFIAELHIDYADGSRETVFTDSTWEYAEDGPYVSDNIYSGDIYDARKVPVWKGFAVEADAPSPVLQAQKMPGIQPETRLSPVAVKNFGDTVRVYDFGKNIAGWCELKVEGDAGTKVTLEHGELLKSDGHLEMGNINVYDCPLPDYEIQKDIYYMKGGHRESWSPSFSYHGFRYVEVRSDRPIKMDRNSLTAVYLHTGARPVGTFHSSEPLLNTIYEMTKRTFCNNFHSIVTDCPTREKNGWTADGYLAIDISLLNFDNYRFYEKWCDDLADNLRDDGRISGIIPDSHWGYMDWIGPVWDAAMFIIPEKMYEYTGDTRQIEKLWPVWERYLDYLKTRETEDGVVTYGIGDWVWYKVPTPTEFTSPLYYYYDYKTMARFASITGRDASPFAAKAEQIKTYLNDNWFDSEKNIYANGSQCAQGIALYMGIVPEGHEQAVADNLAKMIEDNDGMLEFGSMGSRCVLQVLTDYGHVQTAFNMATKRTCPSWGWWVEQGFTTLAETWALSPEFKDASLDHVFLGGCSNWYVTHLAGIRYNFDGLTIKPHFPEGLDEVSASYESIYGTIRSHWKRLPDGSIDLKVEVPPGLAYSAQNLFPGK